MIITAISTAEVRLVLRVYFLILLALTGYLARKTLHSRAKIRILGNHSVPATRVLGSLDGLDLLLAPLRLRAFPSGPFGFAFLLLLFAIGKAADLLTSYLVVSQPIQSRCAFGQGLVFNDDHTNFPMPPFNGRPVQVVQNAQLFAVNHSCSYGIYKKLNTDFRFCPDERDILGSWTCQSVGGGTPQSYAAGTDHWLIAQDLVSGGLLYNSWWHERAQWSSGFANHLVIWSTSTSSDSEGSLWSVKAAVQTTFLPEDDIKLLPLSCTVTAPGARITLENMASVKALRNWSPIFQGLMYWGTNTTAIPDIPDALAMLLNTMTMVSGGSNYLLATPPAGEDTSQGCRVLAAYVPPTMVGIVGVVTALGVLTCSAWCTIAIRLRYAKRDVQWPKSAREVEFLPLSVEEWAAFGARERLIAVTAQGGNAGNAVAPVEATELKNFGVGFSQADPGRVRILRAGRRLRTGGHVPVQPAG
ncbi:hypothetical protein F53441_13678 [Fusarium austroafricanum]|uniref:Uncharacterized protein n=1 Tax=Fusarium austroafricanum TaxID=2364996 RepID=A0A8H4JLT3_9HYPO|nr:hypothetical protein F53441_13678 [Fusarium austroafricanum]